MSAPGRGWADRREAGRALGEACVAESGPRTVVVGLARGGVPVAAEVAAALGAPLDVVVVRKIGHPLQPELALGAVTADGRVFLPPLPAARAGIPLQRATSDARSQARTLEARLRAGRSPLELDGADCVLVDDGLATGASMRAAVAWARARGAARVVAAAPIGAAVAAEGLREEADAVVCVVESDELGSVGQWYDDFEQVPEEAVAACLDASAAARR